MPCKTPNKASHFHWSRTITNMRDMGGRRRKYPLMLSLEPVCMWMCFKNIQFEFRYLISIIFRIEQNNDLMNFSAPLVFDGRFGCCCCCYLHEIPPTNYYRLWPLCRESARSQHHWNATLVSPGGPIKPHFLE